MKNILVALSLQENYEPILAYTRWISSLLNNNVSVKLISVADYSLTPPAYLIPYIEKEIKASEVKLLGICDELKGCGIDTSYVFIKGRLIESFNKAICEFKADFMILGYKSHFIRTSSSEKMIKTLNIPMLVIRGKKAEGINRENLFIRNLLFVTDFSENSLRVIKLIETLYKCRDEKINLTIVNVLPKHKVDDIFDKIPADDISRQRYCEELMKDRYDKLEQITVSSSSLKKSCAIGIPYKVINELAHESDADLIFMGAKGATSAEGLRIGSVSESVIKSSPCPVVLVN